MTAGPWRVRRDCDPCGHDPAGYDEGSAPRLRQAQPQPRATGVGDRRRQVEQRWSSLTRGRLLDSYDVDTTDQRVNLAVQTGLFS